MDAGKLVGVWLIFFIWALFTWGLASPYIQDNRFFMLGVWVISTLGFGTMIGMLFAF